MARDEVIHYKDVLERLTNDVKESRERRERWDMLEEWLRKIVERKRKRECLNEAYLKLGEMYPLALDDDEGWCRRLFLQSPRYGEDPLPQMEVKERDLVTKSYHEAYRRLEKESPLRINPSQCKELFIQDLARPSTHVEQPWTLVVEEGKKRQEREEKETLKKSLQEAYRKMEEERPLRLQPSLVSELARRRDVFDERLKVSEGDGKNEHMWERRQLYRKVIDEEEARYWRALDAVLEVDVREAYLKLYVDRPVLEEPHKNRARAERKSAYTLTLEEVQTMSHWDKEVARRKTNILSEVVDDDIFQYRRAERLKQEQDRPEDLEEGRESKKRSQTFDVDELFHQLELRDARWKEKMEKWEEEAKKKAKRVEKEAKEAAKKAKEELSEEEKKEAKKERARVRRKLLYDASRSERETAKKVKEEASKVRREVANAARNAAAREKRAVVRVTKGL